MAGWLFCWGKSKKKTKKKQGWDRNSLEMKKAETWLCMKKQIFLNNVGGGGKERERECVVQTSKQTAAQSQVHSACTLIFSTKLTLIRSVPSASLNTLDCLYQFAGFYCGKLFHCLAHKYYQHCTAEYNHSAYRVCTDPPSAENAP